MLNPTSYVRQRLLRQSVTVKIVLAVLLVYCLIVGVGSAAILNVAKTAIAHNAIETALYHTQLLKGRIIDLLLTDIPQSQVNQGIQKILKEPVFNDQINEINIFNEKGKIIFSSRDSNLEKKIEVSTQGMIPIGDAEDFFSFNGSHSNSRLRMLHTVDSSQHCVICRFQIEGEPLGGIEVFIPLAPIFERFTKSRIFFVSALIGIIGAGLAMIWWIVHQLVKKPIKQVIAVMEQAKRGELGARTKVPSDPDLKLLAQTFNSMVESIQNAQERIEEQHQKELSQSNRLASLGQMISNVSHEIKNPLTAITSALHAMRRDLEAAAESEIFQELIHQIGRIEQTVNHLLRYARQAPPKFEPCLVSVQIEQALRLAEHRLFEKKIRTKLDCESDLNVLADAGQLQQVFLNLFLNAVGAMPQGGLLSISAKKTKSNFSPEELQKDEVLVEVKDTGLGIKPEDFPHLFEPFFTTKPGGTGLGLSVVKGIMKAHRGTIEIQSDPARGTCVVLRFPDSVYEAASLSDVVLKGAL